MTSRVAVCLVALLLGAGGCSNDGVGPPRASAAESGDPTPGRSVSPAVSSSSQLPRVTVEQGELEGLWVSGGVRAFLGIPFAKPPTGDLRWAAPEPADAWEHVRDAKALSVRCPQPPSSDRLNVASEDCLYLNVWTPPETGKLAPVMVWIHGGGNVNGSATEWVYDGGNLAREFGVVLVTVNYRLGVFGFFAPAADSGESIAIAGNQGLWDQQRALRWVKDNIEVFGGDRGSVTIFGESAGSTDVCMHMASPHSRGLFHRAISQSGGCTTLRGGLESARRATAALGTRIGCGEGEGALACLREKSIVELVDAAAVGGGFNVIVDGDFMPEQPRALFDRGEIADVPYMLGSTTDEGSYWTLDDTGITDDAQYLEALRRRFPEPAEPIAELYPASRFAEAKNPYQAALTRAWGDYRLVCSTQDVAVRALAAGRAVFTYNFDVPIDETLGAAHAAEIVFVFGTSMIETPETARVTERMQTYWTQFARHGDPNHPDVLEWPRNSEADPDIRINFALESTIIPDFRKPECDFWRATYDRAFDRQPNR